MLGLAGYDGLFDECSYLGAAELGGGEYSWWAFGLRNIGVLSACYGLLRGLSRVLKGVFATGCQQKQGADKSIEAGVSNFGTAILHGLY